MICILPLQYQEEDHSSCAHSQGVANISTHFKLYLIPHSLTGDIGWVGVECVVHSLAQSEVKLWSPRGLSVSAEWEQGDLDAKEDQQCYEAL